MHNGRCKQCGDASENLASNGNNVSVCLKCRQNISFNKMNLFKRKAISKRFRKKHDNKIRQNREEKKLEKSIYNKKYYKDNKDDLYEKLKVWKLKNPDKIKAIASRAYKKKKNL